MLVVVRSRVTLLAGVRVRMKMQLAVGVSVGVKVDTLAQQALQHIDTQADQHQANHQFKHLRQCFRYDRIQQQHQRTEHKQGQRMAQPPHRALTQGVGHGTAARRQRSHGSDVITLQRMPHAE